MPISSPYLQCWTIAAFVFLGLLNSPTWAQSASRGAASIVITTATGGADFIQLGSDPSTMDASIPVTVATGAAQSAGPVEVYACADPGQVALLRMRNREISSSALRIMNDRGLWQTMSMVPGLDSCQGVRVAVVRSSTASFVVRLRLNLLHRQTAGTYEGLLTLVARKR